VCPHRTPSCVAVAAAAGSRCVLSPLPQESFALKVLSAGKPTAVVLINGGAVSIDTLVAPAGAIVEAFYPGKNAQAR
jgi:hypothetical protein